MKTSAKVLAKKATVKTIDTTRALESIRVSSMYKTVSLEFDGVMSAMNAREQFYKSCFLTIANKMTVTRNLKKSKLVKATPIEIYKVDYDSPKFTAFENDLIQCLLSKYVTLPHTIEAGDKCEAIELRVNAATTTRIVAAMQMTSAETRALPETDDKYRIRVACLNWIKVARNRIMNYCKAKLEMETNELLGIKPKPKATAKGKTTAKSNKVDLANKGKGITTDQIIALMINGCAKLTKDEAEAYLDKLADQIDSLRERVVNGKQVMEVEA